MDNNESTTSQGGDTEKKGPFDGLDREELIKKCKGLLGIAQKAKKAKDDYANEVADLKEQLTKFETQKHADKECLKAMQEMVDSLTEHKLSAATRIADAERNENLLKTKVAEYENQLRSLADLSIEHEAQKRQLNRLTEENEEQAIDLFKMNEKLQHITDISESQNIELKELEKKVEHWKEVEAKYDQLVVEYEALQTKFDEIKDESQQASSAGKVALEEENKALKDSLNQMTCDFEKAKNDLDHLTNELLAVKEQSAMTLVQVESNKMEYMKQNEELKEQLASQANKMSKYKSKLIEFSSKLKQLRHTKEILLNIVTDHSEAITKWQNDIMDGSKQLFDKLHELEQRNLSLVEHLKTNAEAMRNETNEKNQNLSGLQELDAKYNELFKERDSLIDKLTEQENLIETLKSNGDQTAEFERLNLETRTLNATLENLQVENRKLREQIDKLKLDLENLNENNAAFSECKNALQNQTETLEREVSKLKEDLNSKDLKLRKVSENIAVQNTQTDDLLMEMRELNEALKNRGDVISKQNSELSNLQQLLQEHASRINELDSNLKDKDKSIEHLTSLLAKYEKSEPDGQSEILSTSTISRFEEAVRMRDIEDSFEEKYNKLRGLAIKLKKKVAEQQATIAKLEVGAASQSADGSNLKIQNLKSLQMENDRLLDKNDTLTTEKTQLTKEISVVKEQLEQKLSESVTSDVANSKNESALNKTLNECKKENRILKEENNNLTAKLKDIENECIKLNDEVKARKAELDSKMDEEKKLKSELNKIKSSVKKNNVLNLEMEAYEKSLKEISQKLESKNLQLAEIESANKMLENTIDTLKNEIKLLDESLRAEKQHSIDLKQEMDMQQIKLKESEHEKSELKIKIDETTKELNGIKLELADLRTEQSQYTVDKQKLLTTLETENERNVRKIFAMEDEIRTLQVTLNQANQDLVTVQMEFASYKMRAQSILRQSQTKDSSNEDELKEELASVTQAKETLVVKLNTHVEQLKSLQNQCEELKCDKENLQMRCKELLQLLDESRHQIDTVQEENRRQMQEQQEALKVQRLQIDTLNACYKKQIDELEEKYKNELNAVKHEKNVVANETKVMGEKPKPEQIPLTNEQRIDLILMERQAGEGSENTGSFHNVPHRKTSTVRNKRDLIPLDELLNTTFDDDEPAVLEEHSISPTIELQSTKERFQVQQRRVKHLSTLLSEAELDVARLTQLNDVLKEELRRHERSTEREMHMHNLEYMKNVIFKFLTINNADERAHLVPVLITILKLSPEEAQRLQNVAKGGETSQSSWSNILPIW